MRYIYNIIDSFKPVDKEAIECYQQKLPESINVRVNYPSKGKCVASIRVGEDILYTQARNQEELEDMVNDAVYTYYEVPPRFTKYLILSKKYNNPSLARKRAIQHA